ncbi:hybrid-cluster NAD(P)-dependent oxidoreductase [Vibrio salinus]|uniref:hybrid-cluster NAD(P)-dependent oxidoreductase n=1 Tax=Vibrio salinus TaxID=2899784 RepID=UPI001E3246C4|nr:hybrid-cluster NAD(P)-dependent oxidoreductase [Vibrio salinus]MCE0495487.1 hybrid-cluster NAD(P)-dependent oxidoreductase [Vibrio salinus]
MSEPMKASLNKEAGVQQTGLILTCIERQDIARDFVTFWFTSHPSVVNYLPGQFVAIDFSVNDKVETRYYTLSSSPSRPDKLGVSVKRVDRGLISNWMLENIKVGDELKARIPEGSFYLEHTDKPLLFLSAGSGITPMLSMIRYLADKKQLDDVIFYHQCRTEADIPCRDELTSLSNQYSGLKILWSLTQPQSSWYGIKGRLSLSHIKQIENVTQRDVFVCGPEGFMQKAKALLLKKGLPEDRYHEENFSVSVTNQDTDKSIELSINGVTFTGNNKETLLEQAEAHGVDVVNSCRAGFCGACCMDVVSGEFVQAEVPALSALRKDYPDDNLVLACCCVPATDMKVENK